MVYCRLNLPQPKKGLQNRQDEETKCGKGTKIMAVADRHGLPIAVCVESAAPHEVTLATSTLAPRVTQAQL